MNTADVSVCKVFLIYSYRKNFEGISYFWDKFESPMHNYRHISIAIDLTTLKNKINWRLITKLSKLQP